ncbi:transposable element Tc3 transposase [Trichonephila clavipes]|nr:transposable element Tc3 transposase [Trichonephila clavipes]
MLPWPAHSPDLLPIENMWSMVDQRLTHITPPAATPDQIWQCVEANWSDVPKNTSKDVQELWFQQDGATCHTARATIDLLKDTLTDRLISRFGPVNWPPRSCDLTPLDYFLWGYVKSLVYADKPQTLDHLEDNIHRVIADIRPQMLENWTSRLDYIRASRGSLMPEIIFIIIATLNSSHVSPHEFHDLQLLKAAFLKLWGMSPRGLGQALWCDAFLLSMSLKKDSLFPWDTEKVFEPPMLDSSRAQFLQGLSLEDIVYQHWIQLTHV